MNEPVTQEGMIRREIEIDAPIDQVWPLVATEAGLSQWWGNGITLEPEVGGRCTERRLVQGQVTVHHGTVSVYAPPHQLTLTFIADADFPAMDGERVEGGVWTAPDRISITLEEAASRTRVAVVHRVMHQAAPAIGHAMVDVPRVTSGPWMGLPTASFPAPSAAHPTDRIGTLRGADLDTQWLHVVWGQRLRRLVAQAPGEAVQHG